MLAANRLPYFKSARLLTEVFKSLGLFTGVELGFGLTRERPGLLISFHSYGVNYAPLLYRIYQVLPFVCSRAQIREPVNYV